VCALNDEKIKNLIKEHIDFYGKADKFYKKTTTVENKLDAAILNEFRYCARSQKDILNLLFFGTPSYDEVLKLIEPATRALKCAINDSIDGLVTFVKAFTKIASEQYPNSSIEDVYGMDKYISLWQSVVFFENQIAESRKNLSDRIHIYEELLESKELEIILDFLSKKEIIEAKLNKQNAAVDLKIKELNNEKSLAEKALNEAILSRKIGDRNYKIAIIAAIFTIAGLLMPDELKNVGSYIKCHMTTCSK
jgi:hypothetical protein